MKDSSILQGREFHENFSWLHWKCFMSDGENKVSLGCLKLFELLLHQKVDQLVMKIKIHLYDGVKGS